MPNLTVSDDLAFITDPKTQTVGIVDLTKAEDGAEAVVTAYDLPQVPNKIAVARRAVSDRAHAHEDGEDHDH